MEISWNHSFVQNIGFNSMYMYVSNAMFRLAREGFHIKVLIIWHDKLTKIYYD